MDFSLANPLDGALLLAGGLILVALLVWRLRAQRGTPASRPGRPRTLDAVDTVIGWPPEATRVLTVRHQRAMEVLRRAMPGHLILAQVPLSHFIKVPTRLSYVEWLRRVGHVCVDLMVCDAASNVVAIIEVRQADRTESERARKRHQRVERVLRAAGIPLHVWNESVPSVMSTRARTPTRSARLACAARAHAISIRRAAPGSTSCMPPSRSDSTKAWMSRSTHRCRRRHWRRAVAHRCCSRAEIGKTKKRAPACAGASKP